jgi:hypothetical protein
VDGRGERGVRMRVERVKGEINSYERKYFGYLAVESSKKWENGGRENKHRERERERWERKNTESEKKERRLTDRESKDTSRKKTVIKRTKE